MGDTGIDAGRRVEGLTPRQRERLVAAVRPWAQPADRHHRRVTIPAGGDDGASYGLATVPLAAPRRVTISATVRDAP